LRRYWLRARIFGSVQPNIAIIRLSVQSAQAATSARLLVWLAAVGERQYRGRSPLPKPLIQASVETFDQFVDDLEPASPPNACWR
jgi:hypothetical protein